MRNTIALTALGLGAAFLMRNKNSRNKLMKQFENFTGMSSGKNGASKSMNTLS